MCVTTMNEQNQKVKILIVEDNQNYALELEMLIAKLGYEVMGKVDNEKDLFKILKVDKPDLILMDIKLNGKLDGIDIAKEIEHENINIIFITNFDDQQTYQKAKSTAHYGFIVKPFNHLTLESAIEIALMSKNNFEETQNSDEDTDVILPNYLFLKKRNKLKKVALDEIIYLEVDGNYCLIFTSNEKYILKLSLKKAIELINENYFVRINKSQILNMNKVTSLNLPENQIFLDEGKFSIGRTYRADLIKKLRLLG